MSYEGIVGHKVGSKFDGFLPPHPNVRVYEIFWLKHTKQPEIGMHQELRTRTHTEEDLDKNPMPTMRIIPAEFVPCVIAIYRDIVRDYADSSYEQRNRIWNCILSAMKHSLATIRDLSGKKRRRRPLPDSVAGEENNGKSTSDTDDTRAMKKATKLALEGCVSKATRVLDQEVKQSSLRDEEKMEQLQRLHPQIPVTFGLPADAPKIACIDPHELREAGKRLAKGSSPGPIGTTDTIVRLLLDDEICCTSLCHMMCDLINGLLSKEVMKRLRRARLIALPKKADAVRPIAMGEIFLKLAGLVLLLRNEHSFESLFLPMQHGVMSKAGCETIVHELNRRYLEGNAILTLDLKNAFNSPSRDEIAKAVFAFHTLRPFQRFFTAEYGDASELLFYGKNGELFGTVNSAAGVRQGSPLSSLYFCTLLQPILESIAQDFPTIRIYAYVDDINLTSPDTNLLQQAYHKLKEMLAKQNIIMAPEKCIWFGGIHKLENPDGLRSEGIKTEHEAIKLLGAYVGETSKASALLLE